MRGRLERFAARTASGRTSTPFRLRAWQALTVLLALLFAVLGAYGVNRRSGELRQVRTAADHLIAVQDVRVAVVQADAIASSAYLAGGQERAETRSAYLGAINRANAGLVAVASGVSGPDADSLAAASQMLGTYVGLIEQARANNRQGFPVGAAYQRQASALVSDNDATTADILSVLHDVENGQREQVNDGLRSAHRAGAWFNLYGWALLAIVVLGALWLAARFRRLVNVPLGLAAVLLLLLLLVGGTRQAASVTDTDAAVIGDVLTADLAAQARAAAFDARSQEALALINRGNGAANEQHWKQAAGTADAVFADCPSCAAAQPAFATYEARHDALRQADDTGDWDTAVAMSLGVQGDLVTSFDGAATALEATIRDAAGAADRRIADAADSLGLLRVLSVVGGLAVAVLAALGFGQRLKEYR